MSCFGCRVRSSTRCRRSLRSEAEELFCVRSRLPRDEEIADLCRHLDDLPLAVELAAARTAVLSPAEIRDRLSQRLDLFKGGARRRSSPADVAGDDRVVVRAARRAGAAALRAVGGLCRRLHLRRRRGGRRGRRRHAAVARRQEPRAEDRRALLDAGDDRRARPRAPRGLRRGRGRSGAGMPTSSSRSPSAPSRS